MREEQLIMILDSLKTIKESCLKLVKDVELQESIINEALGGKVNKAAKRKADKIRDERTLEQQAAEIISRQFKNYKTVFKK